MRDLPINLKIGVGWEAIEDNFVHCRGSLSKDAKGPPTSLVNNVMVKNQCLNDFRTIVGQDKSAFFIQSFNLAFNVVLLEWKLLE